MPVAARCPSCSTLAGLPDSVVGKSVTVTCPKCGKPFAVNAAVAPAPVPAPPRSAAPSPVKRTAPPAAKPAPARGRPAGPKPKKAFDFEDDDGAPAPRRTAARGSGKGCLALIVGALCAVLLLAGGAAVYVVFFMPLRAGKAVAQCPQGSTEPRREAEDPQPREAPVAAPPADKQEPKESDDRHESKQPDDAKVSPPEVKKPPEDPPHPEVKKPPEERPPQKPRPEPPGDPVPPRRPPEGPPAPPPRVAHVSKTRDGATTLTAHPEKNLRFAALSPDGKTLYTAAWDNKLRLWDAETFEPGDEIDLPKPDKQPNSRLNAALTPDGKSLLFAHWDFLQIMDLKSKKVEVFEGMPNEEHGIGQIVLSGDGRVALTNWGTVAYALWRVPDRKFLTKLNYDGMGLARGNASLLARDGSSWVHAANNTNAIHVRRLPDLRDLGSWTAPEAGPVDPLSFHSWAPALSAKGRFLAVAQLRNDARSIRVFDLARRSLARDLPLKKYSRGGLDPTVTSIAFSPDDKVLVAMDSDRWVHGYDLTKGTFLGAFAFPLPRPWSSGGDDTCVVQFSADGQRLVAAGLNLLKVWDRDKLTWPDPTDPTNQPVAMAGPDKPPEKMPRKKEEPLGEGEYKDAILKSWERSDYSFEVGGQVVVAQAGRDTVWLDPDGKKVGESDAMMVVLRNVGNTMRFKAKRVPGQKELALVEVQVTKLVAEYPVVEGSVELKGARVSKVVGPRAFLAAADGKEYETAVIYSTIVKDDEGKSLTGDDRFKTLKAGAVVDAVIGPPIAKQNFRHLLFARPAKKE